MLVLSWLAARAALLAPLAPLAAGAQALPDPGTGAWRPVEFANVEAHTSWKVATHEGQPAWKAVSDCAASGRAVALGDVDLERTPLLSFRWRVDEGPTPGDERTRAGDDFAARVYLLFPFVPERASWWERARRQVAETVFGQDVPGSTLSYVWASSAPPDDAWASPFAPESATLVALRSGRDQHGSWIEETVDVAADLARLPERPVEPPSGLAIMSDTDQTCGRAVAWYQGFRFHARDDAGADGHESPAP